MTDYDDWREMTDAERVVVILGDIREVLERIATAIEDHE